MTGFLVIVVFLIGSAAMIRRWLPALLTLPIMAVAMVLVTMLSTITRGADHSLSSLISVNDLMEVIRQGSVRLHVAIITAFFGGMISFVMQKSGTAESLVKNGAELVGDNPFAVAALSMILIALLFTTIGGLGALIMVSLVVLPMMATVGVPPVVSGGVMLIGLSMGGSLNAGNWTGIRDSINAPPAQAAIRALSEPTKVVTMEQLQGFGVIMFFLMGMTGLIFIAVELLRARQLKKPFRVAAILAGLLVVGAVVIFFVSRGMMHSTKNVSISGASRPLWLRASVGVLLVALLLSIFWDNFRKVKRWRHQVVTVKWYAYLIPLIPLVLIFAYNIDPLPAFLGGFVYAVLATMRPGSTSLTIQSMIQGASATLPAVILMIGIGILVTAVLGPAGWSDAHGGLDWPVLAGIKPAFAALPSTQLGYIIVFALAAPLALYRGPLNTYGLGFGIAAVLVNVYPAAAVMAMLSSVGQIQGVCDPTNTANVWLANELRVDVMALMWRTLPYIWIMGIVGLIISAFVFL